MRPVRDSIRLGVKRVANTVEHLRSRADRCRGGRQAAHARRRTVLDRGDSSGRAAKVGNEVAKLEIADGVVGEHSATLVYEQAIEHRAEWSGARECMANGVGGRAVLKGKR